MIAGTGRRGGSPAGVLALESSLGSPEGVAVDEGGLVYVVDSANHVVLRIEHDGGMTRIAGTGERGFGGDGGPATDASLAMPYACGSIPVGISTSRTLAITVFAG